MKRIEIVFENHTGAAAVRSFTLGVDVTSGDPEHEQLLVRSFAAYLAGRERPTMAVPMHQREVAKGESRD